jgi:O-antigen/teichoic acid export membrane protein
LTVGSRGGGGSLRRIVTAYGTGLLSIFTTLLSALWLIRVVAAETDPDTFGAYALVNQLSVITGVFLLGLDSATGIKVAEALSRGDPTMAARVAGQLRWFCRVMAMGLAAVTLLVTGLVSEFHRDAAAGRLWAELVGTTGGSLALGFLSRSSAAVLAGSELLAISNLIRLGQQLAAVILGYVLFRSGWGVVALPAAECGTAGLAWLVLARSVPRFCPWLTTPVPDPWAGFSGLVVHGVTLSLAGFGAILEYASDPVLLRVAAVDGLGAVAAYSLWFRFPALAFSACLMWSGTAVPSLAAAYAGGPVAGRALCRQVLFIEGVQSTAFAIGIGVWLPAVVHVWLGGQYDRLDGVWLGAALGTWVACRSRMTVLYNILNATNRHRAACGWMWALPVVKVAVGFLFTWAIGMTGLALASCVACGGIAAGMALVMGRRGVVPRWTAVSLLIPVGAGLLAGLASRWIGLPSPVETGVGIVATGLALAAAAGFVARIAGVWGRVPTARTGEP